LRNVNNLETFHFGNASVIESRWKKSILRIIFTETRTTQCDVGIRINWQIATDIQTYLPTLQLFFFFLHHVIYPASTPALWSELIFCQRITCITSRIVRHLCRLIEGMKKIRSLSLTHLCSFVYRTRARVLNRSNRNVTRGSCRSECSRRASAHVWRRFPRFSAFYESFPNDVTQREFSGMDERQQWKKQAGKNRNARLNLPTMSLRNYFFFGAYERDRDSRSRLRSIARDFREFRDGNCSLKRSQPHAHSTFISLTHSSFPSTEWCLSCSVVIVWSEN